MKKIVILGLALALVGGAAYANFCARDFVPAATLLVPYAVVALDNSNVPDPSGYTTILDVINVSSAKQIIHVVMWDALSEPVVDFDEVLSGYDVWQINFQDLLRGNFNVFDTGDYDGVDNGNGPKPLASPPYPQIGDFWKGPVGTVTSPWAGTGMTGFPTQYGPSSNSTFTNAPGGVGNLAIPQDIDFTSNAGCAFPYGTAYQFLGPQMVADLQAAILPGLSQDAEYCMSPAPAITSPTWLVNTPDNPVFFYVTIDVVKACNRDFPNNASDYWESVPPYPTANNVIIGNIFYLSPTGNFSDSVPAVSIEADFDWQTYAGWNNASQTVGFYSEYSESYNVHDWHEPLPTAYAFEYYNGSDMEYNSIPNLVSNLIVWKNYSELAMNKAGTALVWDACLPYIYYAWDANENCKARGGQGPSGWGTAEPNALPYQTQKVPLTPANFDGLPAYAGWMLLVFDPSIKTGYPFANDTPGYLVGGDELYLQAWAGVQYYWGAYSTELEAATLGNFWCFSTDLIPGLNTNVGLKDTILNHVVPK